MKYCVLVLMTSMTATAQGMETLKNRLEDMYLFDIPGEQKVQDVNALVQGKTVLDWIYASGKQVDLDFVEFMRQRGARAAYELAPRHHQDPVARISRLVNHIAPAQVS